MKKLKLAIGILSIILQVMQLSAQNIPLQSLTSGGTTLSSSTGVKLDVSLGQVAVNSLSSTSNNILTQGFQQANRFTVTDIDVIQLLGVVLYPNPTSNYIQIDIGNQLEDKTYNWTIMNSLGQTLSNGKVDNKKTQIDVSSLPYGNYCFYIHSSKHEYGTIKFVKSE